MGADHIPVAVSKPSQWKGKDPDKWGFFMKLTFGWQNRVGCTMSVYHVDFARR